MLVPPTPLHAATLGLALLGASCSLTTDLSGLQKGAGGESASTSTSATTTTASTASGAPVCGDGVIQAGEECDDGNDDRHDECVDCEVQCNGDDEAKDPSTFHCYWYDGFTRESFAEASADCADWRKNGTLVAVNSQDELFFLTFKNSIDSETWLGATDSFSPGVYQWVTGEPWDYTNWASNYPNDGDGFSTCVMFGHQNLKWENTLCKSSRFVLCESPPPGEPAP